MTQERIKIKVNEVEYEVDSGLTVLDACHSIGIDIPTLCWMRETNRIGACRMCLVEVKGSRTLVAACVYPAIENIEIRTDSERVHKARKINLELLLSDHEQDCLSCIRSTDCELQRLCRDYWVDSDRFSGARNVSEKEVSTLHLVRDNAKCILCRRCVAACQNQRVSVVQPSGRGFETHIACAFEAPLAETACISCGQCIVNCPTGALRERDNTDIVYTAISDPSKVVVVQTAPSVRATLGEAFGMPVGTNVEGRMAAALRRLGFNYVFDTDTAADFTIVEEAHEFMERIKNGGTLPLLTSCCPGWVKYCEMLHPELFANLSSCKSPQGMMGGLVKTWWAQNMGIDPDDIVMVSIMPCTAKKFEVERYYKGASGESGKDNDIALTTRELSRMIRKAGLHFTALPDEPFDSALGLSSGAATIFGASGGVLEAALRTAASWTQGSDLAELDFKEVRGVEGAKEAVYQVGELNVSVCSVSGMDNVENVLRAVKAGKKNYHIIEIMACPGGCINGGGQPPQPAGIRNFVDLKSLRAQALYGEDAEKTLRLSHKNPIVTKVYEDYFKEAGSHLAHKVLHTAYHDRPVKY